MAHEQPTIAHVTAAAERVAARRAALDKLHADAAARAREDHAQSAGAQDKGAPGV